MRGQDDVRSRVFAMIVIFFFALALGAVGCSGPEESEITVLDLAPPTTDPESPDQPSDDAATGENLSGEGIGDDGGGDGDTTTGAEGDGTNPDGNNPDGTNPDGANPDGTPEPDAERTDRDVAADIADAVMSTSNVVLDQKIEDGAAIVGRTACTGVPDTSTQYPIGLELILGPPGEIGSGTPRIVIRSYDDAATAQAAAAARIASLSACVTAATQNMPTARWGTETVQRPIPGDQLWFPTGALTETHIAYSSGRFYAVASNQVPSSSFVPGQVDAWSVSAIQRVIDTIEAETQAEANPAPTPEGQ